MNKLKLRILFYSLAILFIFSLLYIKNNLGSFYSFLADTFYNINKSNFAQSYYEKAFDCGYYNHRSRQRYLEILLSEKPQNLSISAQENLVNLAEDNIQDAVSKKAEYLLEDLKYEIHRKYPQNYIKQATKNNKIIRWNKFPITYSIEYISDIPEYYLQEIKNAFAELQRTGIVSFAYDDKKPNISILIKNSQVYSPEIGKKYVVAYTEPVILGNNLEKMNIVFNSKTLDNEFYTQNQIYNTALHEIFHALGFMGHSFDKNNIMYMSKNNNDIVQDKRASLTEADKITLKLLYEIKPDITNNISDNSKYVPYILLGDNEEINYSKTKEAKNYIKKAPNLVSGYIDYAEILVGQKRYADAIKILEKSLGAQTAPDTEYILYYNLAVCYFYIDNTEMSEIYAVKAQNIKNTSELNYLIAEIAIKKNDYNKAEKIFKTLAENYPKNIDFTIGLANIYIKKYRYLKARKTLKNFILNNPDNRDNPVLNQYWFLLIK